MKTSKHKVADKDAVASFKMKPLVVSIATALAATQVGVGYALADGGDNEQQIQLEEIVVTGTTAVGRTKLESSVAITTAGFEELSKEAAFGTADVLELIPGFWVESSGGVVSNNVAPRGLGGGSSFRFISVQEDGLPVVYDGNQVDSFIRQDITVERLEAIRGGTSGILTVNGPASIVNFISRKGTEEAEGSVRFTTSDYGTLKGDFFYGAPINDDWLYSVGGYYRSSDSPRDTGFTADEGGQIKINLTRKLDEGEFTINLKHIDEKNSFLLPIPLTNQGDPQAVPGIDANDGTLVSAGLELSQLQPGGRPAVRNNLEDGFHTTLDSIGFSFDSQLNDNWSMSAAARYMTADLDVNATFSRELTSVSEFLDGPAPPGAADFAAGLGATGVQASYVNSGQVLPDDTLLHVGISLFRPIEIDHLVGKMQFNFATDNNDLAFGVLFSEQDFNDTVYGSSYLADTKSNPDLVDFDILDGAGNVVGAATDNGVSEYGSWYDNRPGSSSSSISLYVNNEFQATDNLRIDAGARWESVDFEAVNEVSETRSLGFEGDTVFANDSIRNTGSGVFERRDETFDELSWTVGANYTLTDNLALYARYADSYQTPTLGSVNDLNVGISGITFAEFGGRYIGDTITVALTAYRTEFDNLGFDALDFNTGVEERIEIATSADGLEYEVDWRPTDSFSLNARGVLQSTEISGIPSGDVNADFNGNPVQRTPETQIRIQPTYHINDQLEVFMTYHKLGERFADLAASVRLPGYETFAAGVVYRPTDALTFQLKGTNLTDEIGLTEGNPRAGFREANGRDTYLARPIFGRTFLASVTYDF